MHPLLLSFSIWNSYVEISAYSFFTVISALIVTTLGLLISVYRGLPLRKTMLCLLVMAFSFLIGARLLHIATNFAFYLREPERLFSLDLAGFALYGGISLAVIAGVIASRLLKIDTWRLADSIAPALGLGIGVMRIGCYLNGCCFGKPTLLPWGVTFPSGSPAYNYQFTHNLETQDLVALLQGSQMMPVHPAQLYELLAGLSSAVIALWFIRHKTADGSAFIAFTLWFTAFRWLNYYLRVPAPTLSIASWFYPALYGSIIAICVAIIIWRTACFKVPSMLRDQAHKRMAQRRNSAEWRLTLRRHPNS